MIAREDAQVALDLGACQARWAARDCGSVGMSVALPEVVANREIVRMVQDRSRRRCSVRIRLTAMTLLGKRRIYRLATRFADSVDVTIARIP